MVVTSIKRKIAFVETNPPNNRGTFTKCNEFEPYGLELLAAVAAREGFEVDVWQQEKQNNEEFASEILNSAPDVLALSAMTYNYSSSVLLAEKIKRTLPQLKAVIGGPYVSSCPEGLEEALKTGALDFGIKGEAEDSFRILINSIDEPNLNIPGLIFLEKDKFKINPSVARINNLDSLPFALRKPEKIPTKLGKIMYPAQSKQVAAATIGYSRGCPFSCSYCDSRSIWGNQVIWRSPKNVVDEIQELNERYGTNTLLFSDLTFNANPSKVHELCDELIKRNLMISWYVLARVATPDGDKLLMNEALLRKMRTAGCRKIGYGLESVIPQVQREFHKVIPNAYVRELVKIGDEMGILSKGFLIMGEPEYESAESIQRTLTELKRIGFDEIRTSFLTPFPGSALYQDTKAKGLLLTEDLSRYTTDEPILKCKNLTLEELKESRRRLTSQYYTSPEYSEGISKKLSKFPELSQSYNEHHQFLREKGII